MPLAVVRYLSSPRGLRSQQEAEDFEGGSIVQVTCDRSATDADSSEDAVLIGGAHSEDLYLGRWGVTVPVPNERRVLRGQNRR
ncbi:hypothetical protein [Streptomyces sp. NPDC057199]|uniref:hypothetical protein n=1 Tax=Streptomyces sp. NPDC057199 TaxID=3346047 RepID=UPI003640C35A